MNACHLTSGMNCDVVTPLSFAHFAAATRMSSKRPSRLAVPSFTALDGASTPPRRGQRRSCPPSPSASFVSLQPNPLLSNRSSPNRSRSNSTLHEQRLPPSPVCIRSRSSSHPHLSSLPFALQPQLGYFPYASTSHPTSPVSPFFTSTNPAPGYLTVGPRMDDSDTEQDQLSFGGRQLHHASAMASGSINRMRHLSRLKSKDRLGRQDVTETETEREGPARVLPTARGPAHHQSSATPLMKTLIPLILFACRLLAIVPATIGTILHIRNVIHPPEGHTRIDFAVAACWSILTGAQCWLFTSGLLQRWRAYYPLLSTLVRLLALQAICWPATHITLSVLDVSQRPTACWAVVGTTTCISRAIQLWATSNLGPVERGQRVIYGRKWDWGEVALKCGFPCAMVYFVMAWGDVLNRELGLARC